MNKLVESYIEEIYLSEQLYSITAKVHANKNSILSALKSQDPGKVKGALSILPHIPLDKVYELASKHITGFSLEYAKAIKKVNGTPEERQIKAIAISTVYALKKNSKIPEVTKSLKDFKMDPSYAFVIRDIFSALCVAGIAYLGYTSGATILTTIVAGITSPLFIGIIIFLILAFVAVNVLAVVIK
jgi:hypothetical protein